MRFETVERQKSITLRSTKAHSKPFLFAFTDIVRKKNQDIGSIIAFKKKKEKLK